MSSVAPASLDLLVVDDEPSLRQVLGMIFRREGYTVTVVPGVRAALEALGGAPQPFPLVITDLSMPDGSGMDVLSAAKARSHDTAVVLLTAHSTVDNAIEAMRHGAFDFVKKPFDPAELVAVLDRARQHQALVSENRRLRAQVTSSFGRGELVARSEAMRRLLDLALRIAPSRATVLLTGPSGSGKERLARAIHDASDRASGPFLVVNCGALPEALMESELFGHEKGAFTGATGRHLGLFREAQGGTLLLDEVGELPPSLQVKLLRALQERAVRPVGGTQECPVDVRVLAATNRQVEQDVAQGRFRQDLYYRLNVIRLELPPLAERREDVLLLADEFLRKFAAEMGKDVAGFTADARRALERYDYPGNVRQLENIVERGVALAGGRAIGLGELPAEVSGWASAPSHLLTELPPEGCELDAVLGEVERRLLQAALERAGGSRTAAAKLLGLSFRSIRYRLGKHGLGEAEEQDGPAPESDAG